MSKSPDDRLLVPIYWIARDGRPGRLATLSRPRGWDQIEHEIRRLHRRGVDVLVSLLTSDEIDELELHRAAECCRNIGVTFISYPIEDRTVPLSFDETARLVGTLGDQLSEGKGVAVHCRAGIGRSSTIAACVLVSEGYSPDLAFELIRQARRWKVPDTEEQRLWVARFAESLKKS